MQDELKDAILDALKASVEHDLRYADADFELLCDTFSDLAPDDVDATLYLEDKYRELPFPVGFLDATSCGGRWGGIPGAERYALTTREDGDHVTIYLEYMGFVKPLWGGLKSNDTSWEEIYVSACKALEERELP
jgi:hypothetical protein